MYVYTDLKLIKICQPLFFLSFCFCFFLPAIMIISDNNLNTIINNIPIIDLVFLFLQLFSLTPELLKI